MIEKFGFGRKDSGSVHHNTKSSIIPEFSPVPAQQLEVTNAVRDDALGNTVGVPPGTFHHGQYVICNGKYVFTARVANTMPAGKIGIAGAQRLWTQMPIGLPVQVAPFDIFHAGQGSQVYLADIQLEINFFNPTKPTGIEYDQKQFVEQFAHTFKSQVLVPEQLVVVERGGVNFRIKVISTSVIDLDGHLNPMQNKLGILLPQTQISFSKAEGSPMILKGASRKANLFQPNFEFKNMGIGGLDKQFMTILRRAFVTRMASPQDIEKLGITHVKGMLLYGPPGTGKTLIARQIGKMLNAVEPKIVNGPEMLSKFVGASEENIRKLFKDAEDEYRAKGDDSNLHIIIFDELDAVFKQRGSRGDGTGVGDNVVNQLLSKMDGVNQLNNILVIGMTNRKDLIDSALIRPGRFEILLEIPLPDKDGRKQIFTIHTSRMREENLLAPDVDMDELAELTKNYSGAEIAGVVRAASQSGLTRKTTVGKAGTGTVSYDEKKQLIITREDFMGALQDVRPAFGVAEETLQRCIANGMIPFSRNVNNSLEEGDKLVQAVKVSGDSLMSALFYGPAQSGKSAIAATVALNSGFPFVKLVTAENMTGMGEQQKVAHIQQVFADAYRSETSVIVIDDIETIIEWSDVGPRFSNLLVNALRTMIRQRPPADRPLLILGTTSREDVLARLDMTSLFTKRMFVNSVSSIDELEKVMEAVDFLAPHDRAAVIHEIKTHSPNGVLGIGIKTLISLITLTRVSKNPASEFIREVVDALDAKSGNELLERRIANF